MALPQSLMDRRPMLRTTPGGVLPNNFPTAEEYRKAHWGQGDEPAPWDEEVATASAPPPVKPKRDRRPCWHTGWDILNRSGYGQYVDVVEHVAVAEALKGWRELWADAPHPAQVDWNVLNRHICSPDHYTPEWAEALAAAIEAKEESKSQDLQSELDAIPVTKTSEEIMEDLALAESKQAEARLDELLEDIRHGLVNFEERKNTHNVVRLIDELWLRKGAHDIYLERDGLAQGVIVCTQAPTGAWIPTVRRDEIRDWLKIKPGGAATEAAPAASRAAEKAETAVDKLGEYARNAPEAPRELSAGSKADIQSLKNLTEGWAAEEAARAQAKP